MPLPLTMALTLIVGFTLGVFYREVGFPWLWRHGHRIIAQVLPLAAGLAILWATIR